jgi:hypothetical protein
MSTSNVIVDCIYWQDNLPLARVISQPQNINTIIPLIHSSFMKRYQIQVGTNLQICSLTGYIYQSRNNVSGHDTVKNDDPDPDVFTKWFLFKEIVEKRLGNQITRALYLSGFETVEDLVQHGSRERLLKIHKIGPKMTERILSFIETLPCRMYS